MLVIRLYHTLGRLCIELSWSPLAPALEGRMQNPLLLDRRYYEWGTASDVDRIAYRVSGMLEELGARLGPDWLVTDGLTRPGDAT